MEGAIANTDYLVHNRRSYLEVSNDRTILVTKSEGFGDGLTEEGGILKLDRSRSEWVGLWTFFLGLLITELWLFAVPLCLHSVSVWGLTLVPSW